MHDGDDDDDDHHHHHQDDLTSSLKSYLFWLLFWSSSWSTSVPYSKCREGIKFGQYRSVPHTYQFIRHYRLITHCCKL